MTTYDLVIRGGTVVDGSGLGSYRADVGVIGGPHEEMGEEVIAVVQPTDWAEAGDDLAAELMRFCRAHISHVKCPRQIHFRQELPRHQTGKLYKRLIRDEYWGKKPA